MQRGLCFSLEQTGSDASGPHGALRSAVEQTAEHHHKGEHDKIPETAHAMADETGNDHKDRAADGKDRQDIVLPDGGALLLADPLDEHRDIERIDRDDRQLRRVKQEGDALEDRAREDRLVAPGAGEVGKVEVQTPEAAQQQAMTAELLGIFVCSSTRENIWVAGPLPRAATE